MRLVLGLIKGIIIGGLVGAGAYAAKLDGGMHWVTYGVAGFLVGLLAGRPLWSHLLDKKSTFVTPVIKGIVGFGFGALVYLIASRAVPETASFALLDEPMRHLADWQPVMGAIIGALYGAFVEVDDAAPPASAPAKP